jgi:hypothetical protein
MTFFHQLAITYTFVHVCVYVAFVSISHRCSGRPFWRTNGWGSLRLGMVCIQLVDLIVFLTGTYTSSSSSSDSSSGTSAAAAATLNSVLYSTLTNSTAAAAAVTNSTSSAATTVAAAAAAATAVAHAGTQHWYRWGRAVTPFIFITNRTYLKVFLRGLIRVLPRLLPVLLLTSFVAAFYAYVGFLIYNRKYYNRTHAHAVLNQ